MPPIHLMKSFHWLRLACIGALVTAAGAGAGRATLATPDYVEGEVLVQFRAAETWDSAQFTATLHALEMARRFDWLSAHQGQVLCLLRSPTQTTAALIAELSQDLAVALVEPNHLRWTTGMRTPNDPIFGHISHTLRFPRFFVVFSVCPVIKRTHCRNKYTNSEVFRRVSFSSCDPLKTEAH
jgi:hypothetical protein